jgi:hypothetical protein
MYTAAVSLPTPAACTLQLRAVMNGTSGDAGEASVFSWTYKRCADSEFAVLGGDGRRRDRLRGVSERGPGEWMSQCAMFCTLSRRSVFACTALLPFSPCIEWWFWWCCDARQTRMILSS